MTRALIGAALALALIGAPARAHADCAPASLEPQLLSHAAGGQLVAAGRDDPARSA